MDCVFRISEVSLLPEVEAISSVENRICPCLVPSYERKLNQRLGILSFTSFRFLRLVTQ